MIKKFIYKFILSTWAIAACVLILGSCQSKQEQPKEEPVIETLPDGPLYKLFASPDVDMQIQLSMRSLVQKAGLSDSLLLQMAHDSILIVDSLIARLPNEAQAFLDGFRPVDGWSEPLLDGQDYDLAIVSNDPESGMSYITALFEDGLVDLKMYNYKAFNSMYTFPDDLKMIRLDKKVGKFTYKVQGDSLIVANFDFVNKSQNALLTMRELSEQIAEDDYDSDYYAE